MVGVGIWLLIRETMVYVGINVNFSNRDRFGKIIFQNLIQTIFCKLRQVKTWNCGQQWRIRI